MSDSSLQGTQNRANQIPSVHSLAEAHAAAGIPRPVLVATIRRRLDRLRESVASGEATRSRSQVEQLVATDVQRLAQSRLQPVINATGVLLHTNLGRAPLAAAEVDRLAPLIAGYSNVELDLATGERGARAAFVEACAAAACGADAALVVNNCAAALVLAIAAHLDTDRKEVVVSRGELIQIGGGFRIPEIVSAAGASLREVGTTNQTTTEDYAAATGPKTAMLLAVHRSNFAMAGFVATPSRADLAHAAEERGLPLLVDLGSGALSPTDEVAGMPHEPMPVEALADGATLVCFSGDKLIGGPQCGILAGDRSAVQRSRRSPLYRAFRCGKLTLAALQQTLEAHLAHESMDAADPRDRPLVHHMLRIPVDGLRARAEAVARDLVGAAHVSVVDSTARVGGGTLPSADLPSVCLAVVDPRRGPEELLAELRAASPPVIARIAGDQVLIDVRTVLPTQDESLTRILGVLLAGTAAP